MKALKILFMLFALLLAFPFIAWADGQRLVVWQRSGEKVYFDLNEEPETTFEEGNLIIKTSRTTVSYPLTTVLRYTYEGGTITDVGQAAVREGEVRFLQSSEGMAFDGLADGARLDVYSLDGLRVATVQARKGQRTVISLDGHPAGTYIVKSGDATFKFLKR